MNLVEITPSIEGELPLMGAPCLIVRLAGCNLKCPYCDTNHEMKFQMSVSDLIKELRKHNLKQVLLTGGEPLLHMKELRELITYAPEYTYVIETNGTQPIQHIMHPSAVVVMDVKTFKNEFSIERQNLGFLSDIDAVKFVSTSNEEFERNLEWFVQNCLKYDAPMYIFSFSSKELASQNVPHFINFSKQVPKSFRLHMQIQLHKILEVA